MKTARAVLSLAFAAVASLCFAADEMPQVNLTSTKITDRIYVIHGTDDVAHFSGGNIAVHAGEDGVVMIDTKMAALSERVLAEIEHIGGGRPKYVLNTHLHGDHTGGNPEFAENATIIAHTNVRRRLVENEPEKHWPVITFDQSLSIHFNGERIKAIHMPHGHTDGDSIVYFTGANVVHMGDHMFTGTFPYVDLDNGGSVQGMMNNIEIVLGTVAEDTVIIPGHGPVSDNRDLRAVYEMLQETTRFVTEQMKADRSLEQIKAKGLAERWQSWASDFITVEKWIETIYRSYSRD